MTSRIPLQPHRSSTSFTDEEVRVACALLDKLTRKGDIQTLLRNPAYASLARKFLRMRGVISENQVARELDEAGGR